MLFLTLLYIAFTVLVIATVSAKRKFIFIPAILVTVGFLFCAIFFKFAFGNILYVVWLLWVSVLCIKMCRDLFKHYRETAKRKIERKNELHNELAINNERLITRKKQLDKKSFAILHIYEIIKDMSGMLKIEEMAQALSRFLNEHFSFTRCYLAVPYYTQEERPMEKVYRILTSDKPSAEECHHKDLEDWVSNVIDFAKKRKSGRTIKTKDPIRETLGIDKNIKHLDIISLTVEKKIIAVLLIEDLQETQRENFFILASQLSMELKKASLYENVERLSITDGLTEVYLRRYFTDRLSEEVERAKRHNLKFAILMLDLDHFKKCNDTYGHMVGDVVLKETASTIKENVREIDLVARYGGEEFSILLPDTDKENALQVAERIRKAIESKTIVAYDEALKETISIGISIYPIDSQKIVDLINKADKALYRSKQNGRNRVTTFSKSPS